ncbi:MAG: hypothetical protein NUW37_15845 [Planctomycetes bacterium]|nr:hypothetical protein [Planctomycetota bacterium]
MNKKSTMMKSCFGIVVAITAIYLSGETLAYFSNVPQMALAVIYFALLLGLVAVLGRYFIPKDLG